MKIAKKYSTNDVIKFLLSNGFYKYEDDECLFMSNDNMILVSIYDSILLCSKEDSLGKNAYRVIIDDISFSLMKKTLKKMLGRM